ncbi:hypothetical protein Ae406Ps2_1975c [Pseudonocardia sp. Ae406_Ps2]|nr:hypothetical protein Ae406Ps2_1975c [Pseudonocardia sp. Ae406_Ps2]OLM06238.1 hypothetical protein Ae331Ps2_3948 [Pseudonocardia sp. Ae331_Ps2]OLM12977.1 hypothetical protein Ae505Ps2_3105 [Pseudonocardia sp. Ae505_Ps2]OLM23552.1 hypothetical protein Ae706Ps2_1985c [Pseudonocardia sp. Ae706_Ps2]
MHGRLPLTVHAPSGPPAPAPAGPGGGRAAPEP